MDKKNTLLKARIKELEIENAILKKEQIEISKAKELYLKIFEEFPALIWRSRLDKLCDYFNKTWLEFTGRTMEQEFGNGWAEGVHPDDFDFCVKTYVEAFEKREPFLMEYRMKNRFGEYCWIRDFGRPFFDIDDTFLGYIGSCYDITENKNNELRLIELNATKDRFFSIIGHDLKGPFSSIVELSEHLVVQAEEVDCKKIGKISNAILQSSRRAMDLLLSLLTWAQMQSDRMGYNPEYFEVKLLVQEIKKLLHGMAEQKSIIIEDTLMTNSQVFADKEMIRTVLRNLISNGLKFTNEGGKITVSGENKDNKLIVTVSDDGVGISEDRINKLFNIAENQSTTGTQNEKGTGLGLILCKEFIEKNKGEIWVESKVGSGSFFTFSIPLTNETNASQSIPKTHHLKKIRNVQ